MFKNNSSKQMNLECTAHFSLRKISVGLASVLIGTSLYFINSNTQTVFADTTSPSTEQTTQQTTDTTNDSQNEQPVSTNAVNNNNDSYNQSDTVATTTNQEQTDQLTADKPTETANNSNIEQSQNGNIPVNITNGSVSTTNEVKPQDDKSPDIWYDYDEKTNTLNIHGNKTFENPDKLFGLYNQYGQKVQQINIADKTTIIGSAEKLFANLTNLTNITGLSNLDTKQVTNMNGMFSGSSLLTSIDISKFDFSNVKTMDAMFSGSGIKHLDLSNHIAPMLEDMTEAFQGMYSLEYVNLSNFVTGRNTQLTSAFANNSKLIEVNFDGFETNRPDLNPNNIGTYGSHLQKMFLTCDSLQKVDFSKAKIRDVESASNMIMECPALTDVDITGLNLITGINGKADVSNMIASVDNLRILTLGKQSFLDPEAVAGAAIDAYLKGTWFNKGNGTIRHPQGNKAWTSDDLITNYNPETDADTYVRMFDFHINFIDQNNNNQKIEGTDSIVVDVPSISPEGTDLHIPHFTVERPEGIQDIITQLEQKGYELVKDPFNGKDEINPSMEQTDINFEFKHKSDPQVQEIDKNYVVHFVDSNGKTLAPDHVQTVHFKRTVQISKVNGKVLDETVPWTTTNEYYDDVTIPQIDNYTPSAKTTNGINIVKGKLTKVKIVPGEDVTDTIVYTSKISDSDMTPATDNQNTEKPSSDTSTPEPPAVDNNQPETNEHHESNKPNKPNKPLEHHNSQTVAHHQNNKLSSLISPHSDINKPAIASSIHSNTASLPQTGTNKQDHFILVMLGTLLSMLGITFMPKRKRR